MAIDICYPEKIVNEEEEIDNWHERIMQEENAKKNPLIPSKKDEPENPHIEEEEINMGEGSFSHLEDEMKEED